MPWSHLKPPDTAIIFNWAYVHTGIFPDCLKLARVTPIPKVGDSTNDRTDRPICNRSLVKYLKKNYINKYTHI